MYHVWIVFGCGGSSGARNACVADNLPMREAKYWRRMLRRWGYNAVIV